MVFEVGGGPGGLSGGGLRFLEMGGVLVGGGPGGLRGGGLRFIDVGGVLSGDL